MNNQYPYNLDIEKSIIGNLILFPEKFPILYQRVFVNSFFDERNKKLYEAICNSYEKFNKIDYNLVLNYLKENHYMEHIGGKEYLDYLINSLPLVGNLESEVDMLLDLSFKRDIIDMANEIAKKGCEPNLTGNNFIDFAENKIFELTKKRKSGDFITFKEVTDNILEKIETKKTEGMNGLNTGYSQLNKFTSGFQEEQLIILAARPAVGKSAFAVNLAMNILGRNKNSSVAFFSLEMSNEQIANRIYSAEAQILLSRLNVGELNKQEMEDFKRSIFKISNSKLYFNDASSTNIGDIRSKCRSLKQSVGLDCVIIDYLQLITVEGVRTNNRQEEVSIISRSLKQMARELGIPVIALSQLSRDVEKSNNKLPMLSHLRESGSIEQDADIVLFLHREDYYKKTEDNDNLASLIIAKNRQGISGVNINFFFKKEFVKFIEMEDRFSEDK